MRYSRPNLPAAATTATLLVLVAGLATPQSTAADRPHVLVILADDLGYGDLSSYGAKDLKTPHIDQLVESGIRFDNFYANCPVCSPTRASLLTGRYPELVGVPGVVRTHPENSWGYLAPEARMLPELLRDAGYHTALVGKWHLGLDAASHPNRRGFEHFHGFLGDMMDDYYNHRRHGHNYMRLNGQTIEPLGHATDLFSDWACDYLRQRADRPEPFFLYLAYNAPHTPIQPPQEWIAKVKRREPGINGERARLVALIEHMDAGIGRVLKTLEETSLADNTLVIFSSDNGGQLSVAANNGPLRNGKQSMYEGGLKVPMCAVWPGRIQQRTRSEAVALTMDLMPTICEAANVHIEDAIDGRSLLGLLTGKATELPERDVFFHRREGGVAYGGLIINAVRRGEWKLLQNSPFAPQELYNLRQDPREQHNLAEQNPAKFRELAAALRLQVQRGGAIPWQRGD